MIKQNKDLIDMLEDINFKIVHKLRTRTRAIGISRELISNELSKLKLGYDNPLRTHNSIMDCLDTISKTNLTTRGDLDLILDFSNKALQYYDKLFSIKVKKNYDTILKVKEQLTIRTSTKYIDSIKNDLNNFNSTLGAIINQQAKSIINKEPIEWSKEEAINYFGAGCDWFVEPTTILVEDGIVTHMDITNYEFDGKEKVVVDTTYEGLILMEIDNVISKMNIETCKELNIDNNESLVEDVGFESQLLDSGETISRELDIDTKKEIVMWTKEDATNYFGEECDWFIEPNAMLVEDGIVTHMDITNYEFDGKEKVNILAMGDGMQFMDIESSDMILNTPILEEIEVNYEDQDILTTNVNSNDGVEDLLLIFENEIILTEDILDSIDQELPMLEEGDVIFMQDNKVIGLIMSDAIINRFNLDTTKFLPNETLSLQEFYTLIDVIEVNE